MSPRTCAQCGDENGPFVRVGDLWICEDHVDPKDGSIRRVDVKGGHSALIDVADLPLVSQYTWRPLKGHNGKLYAYAMAGRSAVYMHRLIAGTPAGLETDHVNGDGLDNRRSNLRVATCSQNSANTWKPRRSDGSTATSRFKGVTWDRSRSKWQAKITVDQHCKSLGRYDSEEEAARAYDAAAAARWGAFARLNFPVTREAAA
ncbi:AP2 domain-containing protein [Streptomyces sp. NPDC002467]|uniref:AP2 domain-containing protein n=1 Tax=Streptomyces sp. NPDC002467 TaxID=3364647 RepID=UPI0036891840